MDVGTNTEIVVWDKDRYVLATAPSGPAFEGGRIRDGMRAEEGAIWKVTLNERNLGTKVVGGGPPRGICGTGIVDAIAQLLKMGLLDQSGLMRKNVHPSVVEKGFVLDENTDVILRE